MKGNKVENLIWVIFFVCGLVFTIIGIIICINVFNYNDKIETTGKITEIGGYRNSNGNIEQEVYVEYTVDGSVYESKLKGYSSSFYEGKEIEIYYDVNNPLNIGVKSIDLVFLIFPGIGSIFLVIGGVGIIIKGRRKALEKKLMSYGDKVFAKIIDVCNNTRYTVNGRHPYVVICQWNNEIDGKEYIFKSGNLWFDPTFAIEQKNIDTLPVYIDMKNKKKYVIDTSILADEVVDLT